MQEWTLWKAPFWGGFWSRFGRTFPVRFFSPEISHLSTPHPLLSDWDFAVGYFKLFLHPFLSSRPVWGTEEGLLCSVMEDDIAWSSPVFPLFISASISVKGAVSPCHPKIIYPLIKGYAAWYTPLGCCDCKPLAAAFWCFFWAWIQREHESISRFLWVLSWVGGKIPSALVTK